MDRSRQPFYNLGGAGSGERLQSLLCWVGRVNQIPPSPTRCSCNRFNPCCYGSVASTRSLELRAVQCTSVSILVVMDRSRQLWPKEGPIDVGSAVSILVVMDRSRQLLL